MTDEPARDEEDASEAIKNLLGYVEALAEGVTALYEELCERDPGKALRVAAQLRASAAMPRAAHAARQVEALGAEWQGMAQRHARPGS